MHCTSSAHLQDLGQWYREVKPSGQVEIVYISSDKTKEEFDKTRAVLSCPALPIDERSQAETFAKMLGVDKIPRLVVLEGEDGTVKVQNGRGHVEHAKAKGYPPMEVLSAWRRGPGKQPEPPAEKKARQKKELMRATAGICFGFVMIAARQYGVYPEIHSQAVDTVITILVVYFVRKAIWA